MYSVSLVCYTESRIATQIVYTNIYIHIPGRAGAKRVFLLVQCQNTLLLLEGIIIGAIVHVQFSPRGKVSNTSISRQEYESRSMICYAAIAAWHYGQ